MDAPRLTPAYKTPRKRRRNALPVQKDINIEGTGSVDRDYFDNFNSLLSIRAALLTYNPLVYKSPTPTSRGRYNIIMTGAVNEGDYALSALNLYIDQASLFDNGIVNDTEILRKRARRNIRVIIQPENPVIRPSTSITAAASTERI